jgi:hypothetical protein
MHGLLNVKFMCGICLSYPFTCRNMLNLEFSALMKMLIVKVMVRASATSHKLTYPHFTTIKQRHMPGHTADKVEHWTNSASYRRQKRPLFLMHVTPPKVNWMSMLLLRNTFNAQSMLKNYKCFHLTQCMPAVYYTCARYRQLVTNNLVVSVQ